MTSEVLTFEQLIEEIPENEKTLVLWEEEKETKLKDYLKEQENIKNINIIIGPEGGLSPKEVKQLLDKGVQSASLGSKILRTETAGLVALTIVLYELGDLG